MLFKSYITNLSKLVYIKVLCWASWFMHKFVQNKLLPPIKAGGVCLHVTVADVFSLSSCSRICLAFLVQFMTSWLC